MVEDLRDTQVRWHSSHPDVASVDSVGHLTARKPGRAYVVATAHALTATASIAEGAVDSMPVRVTPADPALTSLQFATVSAPATSDAHFTCATTRDGTVRCFGSTLGRQSALGFGAGPEDEFAAITSPDGSSFVSVAAGFDAICALTARGAAFCFGNNEWGQLGSGSLARYSSITAVAGAHRFQKLKMGRERACAISDAQELYCWGSGLNRALGTEARDRCAYQVGFEKGDTDTTFAPCAREPVKVMPGVPVRDVAVGDDHACALDQAGALYCWGWIYDIDFHALRPIQIGGTVPLVALTSGSRHVCGLDSAGRAYCWGRNWRGQLGQPVPKSGTTLIPVAGQIRFKSLSAGDDHTCGVSTEDQAYCWGEDRDRQLGIGAIELADGETALPTRVAGARRFTAIAAGYGHTCAVSSQGGLFCWGTSLAVRPGLGVLKEEPEPFLVSGSH